MSSLTKAKKRWPKVLGIVGLCIVLLVAAVALWLKDAATKIQQENEASAKALKVTLIEGVNDLEFFYGQDLQGEVGEYHADADSDTFSEYVIYYPLELSGRYPVVVWGNGTGGTYRDYGAALKSLASYGFVVIGNDSENNGSGQEIYEMGLYAEKLDSDPDSTFHGRLDTTNMGVGGHSQGACGAVNAVTKFERSGELFSSVFPTSMPHIGMCVDRFSYWAYDMSQVQVPCFLTSGTGPFDAGSVAPLSSVQENFEAIPEGVPAVMAIMAGADHNIVNKFHACGYMNAWFCWTLKGDEQAGQVFTGQEELAKNNTRWQNVRSNLIGLKEK